MATVTEAPVTTGPEMVAYPITSDLFTLMVEQGLFPPDRRVFLWGGRLYEKMAKSKAHAVVQNTFSRALFRRVPDGLFVGNENPVRLDDTHLPLPDLVVIRGDPFDYYDARHPDGRDVVLVVEVAVSSLPEDLGPRLARYAMNLPSAVYVVADIPHRQVLVFNGPLPTSDPGAGGYAARAVVKPGELIRLRLGDVDLEPIPYDEVMR